ncbi:sigma 54-interacting transcriptional regulator [Rhodovulum sp. DZ06]|uniref:sigma-54-dependent transcriptional regulator n=1 Tax=Rhodovulum sp. DZ06 TaxID=3425126 RepID=UPI003D357E58
MKDGPILLVEDTPSLAMLYETILRRAGCEVDVALTGARGLEMLAARGHPVVLLDLMLPDADGLEILSRLQESAPGAKVIAITANGSINRAVQAMRAGAFDFLVKPFDERRLLAALDNALAARRLEAERDPAGREDDAAPEAPAPVPEAHRFHGFVGGSGAMQEIYAKIRSIARSTATVFITGESGTGKEVCAQAIHAESQRAAAPFVPLNCAAIPRDLLESEVFGHLKGSFTGAISDQKGAAALADGGTLFMDEICEMSLGLQTKLLRFLQTSMIQPVGAAAPRKVDVRILCATNRDPMEEVRQGRFREDLFYRLHVVPIHLPPLRARDDDPVEIANAALRDLAAEEGKAFRRMSPDVEAIFRAHPWPGNVRQLQNAMRNVVVLHDGPEVTADMLPPELIAGLRPVPPAGHGARAASGGAWAGEPPEEIDWTRDPGAIGRAPAPMRAPLSAPIGAGLSGHAPDPLPRRPLHDTPAPQAQGGPGAARRADPADAVDGLVGLTLAEVEEALIERTIARCDGSIPQAAKMLGVSPSTLYRKRGAPLRRRGDAAG